MGAAVRSRNQVPWCGKFISKGRLADWLQLLNLQLKSTELGLYSPTRLKILNHASRIERFGAGTQLPFGGIYDAGEADCADHTDCARWRPLRSGSLGVPAVENIRVTIH